MPNEIIAHILFQSIINESEDVVKAYEACKSIKLNKKFSGLMDSFDNIIIDLLFSTFKNVYPSKLHIAAKLNDINWMEKNIIPDLDKINIIDSNGYTPLAYAMFNISKRAGELLLKNNGTLGNLVAKTEQNPAINVRMVGNPYTITFDPINTTTLNKVLDYIINKGEIRVTFSFQLLIWSIRSNHIKLAAYLICNNYCLLYPDTLVVKLLTQDELKLYNSLIELGKKLNAIKINDYNCPANKVYLQKLPIKLVYDQLMDMLKK